MVHFNDILKDLQIRVKGMNKITFVHCLLDVWSYSGVWYKTHRDGVHP